MSQEDNSGWQWAPTPREARLRYADVVERVTEFGPRKETTIQLIEMGQVVDETILGPRR